MTVAAWLRISTMRKASAAARRLPMNLAAPRFRASPWTGKQAAASTALVRLISWAANVRCARAISMWSNMSLAWRAGRPLSRDFLWPSGGYLPIMTTGSCVRSATVDHCTAISAIQILLALRVDL